MARMRARQSAAGLVTVTLVVPAQDTRQFRRLAANRRQGLFRGGALTRIRSVLGQRMPPGVPSSRIEPGDIMETRVLLEVAAVGLVTRRMTPRIARRLHLVIADEGGLDGGASASDLQRFHLTVGELSGDPALLLFLRLALQLTDEHSTFAHRPKSHRDKVVSRVKTLHGSIAEAIIDQNAPLAARRMRVYLSGLKEWLN